MELIDKLVESKKRHSKFFQKYLPSERIKHSHKIVSLKKDIDKYEGNLISGILSFKYDYTLVYSELKKLLF